MVREICLDSDVIIQLLRNDSNTQGVLNSFDANYSITVINVFELWSGRVKNETIYETISSFDVKEFDKPSSFLAGDIRKKLRASGEEIDIRDIFVAAICISNDIELFTYNKKHFERLRKFGLKLV